MKRTYLILVAILLSTFGFAQQTPMNGIITDDNGQVLERAWVVVLDANNNSYVSGAVTDEYGNFELSVLQDGDYLMSVDHITFEEPKIIDLAIGNLDESENGMIHLRKVGSELILKSVPSNSPSFDNTEILIK